MGTDPICVSCGRVLDDGIHCSKHGLIPANIKYLLAGWKVFEPVDLSYPPDLDEIEDMSGAVAELRASTHGQFANVLVLRDTKTGDFVTGTEDSKRALGVALHDARAGEQVSIMIAD